MLPSVPLCERRNVLWLFIRLTRTCIALELDKAVVKAWSGRASSEQHDYMRELTNREVLICQFEKRKIHTLENVSEIRDKEVEIEKQLSFQR